MDEDEVRVRGFVIAQLDPMPRGKFRIIYLVSTARQKDGRLVWSKMGQSVKHYSYAGAKDYLFRAMVPVMEGVRDGDVCGKVPDPPKSPDRPAGAIVNEETADGYVLREVPPPAADLPPLSDVLPPTGELAPLPSLDALTYPNDQEQ